MVLSALAGSASSQAAESDDGDDVGPWIEAGTAVPEWATAVRVVRTDETILLEPRSASSRRGSAAREARLPFFGARTGPGCRAPWYSVGPTAWVCGDHVELALGEPVRATSRTFEPSSDGLPFRYYFVGPDGTQGYRKLVEVDVGMADTTLDPGFAVAIGEERVVDGGRYGLSGNELWLPMRDLSPTRPFSFQGAEVPTDAPKGSIPFAWVNVTSARVYSGPTAAKPTSGTFAQFVKVDAFEEVGTFQKFTRVGPDKWVMSKDIRRPTVAPVPEDIDVLARERWIDVELASQTLVAYEGDKPMFATLVSSGKGREGSYNATPKGTNRIWVKLAHSNMDNLEDENANRFYRMENVPYVQYFSKGVGLHGAFWHRSFGNVRSHGCVNLAPLDAQRLFWFTQPRLPAGWTAVLPNDNERGSLVRVR